MDASDTTPLSGPAAPSAGSGPEGPSLGAELRQSLLLLAVSIGLTAGVTVAARITLDLLG